MKENSIEQQNTKINVIKEEMRGNLGRLFDDKEKELSNRIDNFILKLESLQKMAYSLIKRKLLRA